MERVAGIEPASSPWKGDIEPFNYTRIVNYILSESRDSNSGPHGPKPCALPTAPLSGGAQVGTRTHTRLRGQHFKCCVYTDFTTWA